MRYILPLALAALTINSTLSAGTYVTTSGVTKELLSTDGTPHTYPGNIGPGANLSGANLSGANLYGANLSWASLHSADLSGANLNATYIEYTILANTTWTNVISQSDYDAVVAERDAVHAKFGSNLIAVANGVADIGVGIETSDDLSIWTTGGTASATVDVNSDSQFIRFSMTENPDSLSDVSQLSHTQSWSQELTTKGSL